jgi:cellulose biosynthesis protein BcsQ
MMAQTHLENLVILPSNYDVSAIDPEISRAIAYHPEKIDGAVSVFRDAIINPLLNDFDAIFIDTAPSSNNFTAATYYASNHVNFVTTGRTQDYRSYIAHHSYLKNTINTVFPSDFDGFDSIKTVITRHINKENDKLSKKIVENVNKIKNVANVYQTFIHESRKYEEASDKHLPLALYESAQDTPYKEAIKECDALYQAVCTTVEPTLFPEGI